MKRFKKGYITFNRDTQKRFKKGYITLNRDTLKRLKKGSPRPTSGPPLLVVARVKLQRERPAGSAEDPLAARRLLVDVHDDLAGLLARGHRDVVVLLGFDATELLYLHPVQGGLFLTPPGGDS